MALCGLSNCFGSSEAQRENHVRAAQPSAVTPPTNNSGRVSADQTGARTLGTAAQRYAAPAALALPTRQRPISALIAQVDEESTASISRTPTAGISQTADPVRSSLLARIERRINAPNELNDDDPLAAYLSFHTPNAATPVIAQVEAGTTASTSRSTRPNGDLNDEPGSSTLKTIKRPTKYEGGKNRYGINVDTWLNDSDVDGGFINASPDIETTESRAKAAAPMIAEPNSSSKLIATHHSSPHSEDASTSTIIFTERSKTFTENSTKITKGKFLADLEIPRPTSSMPTSSKAPASTSLNPTITQNENSDSDRIEEHNPLFEITISPKTEIYPSCSKCDEEIDPSFKTSISLRNKAELHLSCFGKSLPATLSDLNKIAVTCNKDSVSEMSFSEIAEAFSSLGEAGKSTWVNCLAKWYPTAKRENNNALLLVINYQLGKNLNLDDEIRLNNGHHTAEFLLREALSLALNTDHSQISIISKTLLDRYSELNHFNIDGIYIKKSVLAEWANNQNLPKKFNATQRVAAYEQYLESLKISTSTQSVHAEAVVAYTKPCLDEIRTRLQDRKINLSVDTKKLKEQYLEFLNIALPIETIPPLESISFDKELDSAYKSQIDKHTKLKNRIIKNNAENAESKSKALKTINYIFDNVGYYVGKVTAYNESPLNVLNFMVLYIKHIAPKEEFQNLIDSLVRHMGNSILTINSRTVCQHGCITHLLDVPVGIDHSLAMFLNREQIEAEVIAVASWTSEIIESRLARPVKLPDAAQGWDNLGESDEEETEVANSFSQLKRGIMVTAVEKWLCDWGGLTLEQVQPFILSKLPEDGFY